MKDPRILIVDDDAEIRELIALYLEEQGFLSLEARDGESAIRMFRDHHPDLIILDVLMPGMDGFSVCKQLRQESNVPIIFLSSKWGSEDIVKGLEYGADDYVTKPFHPKVLVARVKSNIRRSAHLVEKEDILEFGGLEINRRTYDVVYHEKNIPFLAKEIKLFIFMAERPKQVFNAEQLYGYVWDSAEGDARTVMVHISNIRRKLHNYAPNTVTIETLKGMGYRLVQK